MNEPKPIRALVRPPGESFVRALSSSRAPIDFRLAQAQHAEYCQALTAAALTVEKLPADERYPDSCFMQDPALVVAGQAIAGRMSEPSRAGEVELAADWLGQHASQVQRITSPGLLEGGDVMVLPDRLLIGLSGRTNAEGIRQLASFLYPSGLPVFEVPVRGYLHLLTAATYVGRGVLLAVRPYAGHPAFAGLDIIEVSAEETYAANALAVGQRVILPAGYPGVASALARRGFQVLPVPMSEFSKADGGVTCLSLVW